jgi:hypothetical protein
MRRALTVFAIAIVIAGLALVGYYYFFGSGAGLTVQNGAPAQNPFGNGGSDVTQTGGTTGTDTNTGTPTPTAGTQVAPHLLKITSAPVAHGFIVLNASTTVSGAIASASASSSPTVFSTDVRYIDRQSGNMYAYHLKEGTSERLTNHTAPGVEEVTWLGNGATAFIRFLTADTDKSEHIDTYALPADGSDGRFLARDLTQVLTQGSGTLFTLMPSTSGSVGTISKPDGSTPPSLFTSVLSALHLAFAGTNLLAYTNPSAHQDGYVFVIDRKSGAFSKIMGPLPALTALGSPSGKQALVSYLSHGSLTLALFDMTTHAVTTLPVATLTEKCAWAPDGQSAYCAVPIAFGAQNLPDSWYQGTAAFSDRIWKIDLVARAATPVANLPELSKDPIDAVSLSLDHNESTLVFMNKRDGSLWAYSL